MRFALTLTALVGSAAALQITSPTKDQDVDLSQKTTVEWSSVSSDPSTFDIYLVKMNSYPPANQLVAENVKTSDGSYTIDGLSTDNGSGYQVNFVSKDPQNTGILAQSQQFNVESSGSSTTSSSASTTATETSSSTSSGTASTTASTMTTTTSGTATTAASSTASEDASSTGSATSTPSTTPNGAGSLAIPAGSLLLGLAVLVL
ncbi:hypothetical protein CNMCM6106_003929 [Aspergillus hiratsukae]|uniref:Yeast cell wall synthesis Kre9/Knh1-like N-terminal domain-containing protein n=1 Tax=Aspergillus hiratsukae TaxID=1194566 RepID=A0A8H6PN33_9EURO|nr:hypothetical protein CNMCM6106_003929 [Aspergillus hiratsukae]